jgi:hypothetical protein
MSVCVLLRSKYFGAGKTWAATSFKRPGIKPERLVLDFEMRAESYKSPDDNDHPEKGQFAFTIADAGDLKTFLVSMGNSLKSGTFKHNVFVIDNASMFQDELVSCVQTEPVARALTDAFGCTTIYERNLGKRFKTYDTAVYYSTLKGIIRYMMMALRKAGVDVIITSESKNQWKDYGKQGRDPQTNEPYMKILGETIKVWEPFLQISDIVLVLDRIAGNRELGTGKMMPYPTASLDTFAPKCSIPGIQPTFTFNNWSVFWDMADNRRIPTVDDFSKVVVDAAQPYECETEMTDESAKSIIIDHAINKGIIKSKSAQERIKIADMAKKIGLDPANIVVQFNRWIEMINDEAEKNDAREAA